MKSAFFLFTALVLAGCQAPPPPRDYVPAVADFYLESNDARAVSVTLPKSGVKLAITRVPAILAGDIADVELAQVELGRCLRFQLTPAAARDLYRLSASNQGRRLVLLINGAAFGARPLEAPITDGMLFVFVEMPDEALPALVANLKRTSADLQRALAKKK
jgi:hypothetical protein